MKHAAYLVALPLALAAAVAVGREASSDPAPKVFRAADLPFQIAAPTGQAPPALRKTADNHIHFDQTVAVKLDNESAPHAVTIHADHRPIADGGQLGIVVNDGSGNSAFQFDPRTNSITLNAGGHATTIAKTPSGYLVDGKPSSGGKAAFALLRATDAYRGISPHSILAAYAVAQNPAPEVKSAIDDGNNGGTHGASGPAVCTLFKDLCDCAACDASGKGSSCSRCQ